jgi:hypothetical protein
MPEINTALDDDKEKNRVGFFIVLFWGSGCANNTHTSTIDSMSQKSQMKS